MQEIWKDIEGFEGYYQVSNKGSVKALDRKVPNRNRIINRKGHVLKQYKQGKYYGVALNKNGINKMFLVHRLVAKAFISNPENKPCVNHINPVTKDFCDNRVENLEWATYSENNLYAYKIGNNIPNYSQKGRVGILSGNHKEIYQIDKNNNKIIAKFISAVEAEEKTGICRSTICQVCKKIKKTAGGYKWQYVK